MMKIGYVVTDATTWEVDPERDASGFDAGYYERLMGKTWDESAFVFYTPVKASSILKGRFGSFPIIDFCMHRQV